VSATGPTELTKTGTAANCCQELGSSSTTINFDDVGLLAAAIAGVLGPE